jgi:predicted PurR-regulated permease PerM
MRAYFTDRNIRRLFVLVLFLGFVWFFRELMLLLIFFVIFERLIGLAAGYVSAWTKIKFKYAVIAVAVSIVGGVVGLVWFGINRLLANLHGIQHGFVDINTRIHKHPLYQRYGHFGGSITPAKILEKLGHHASDVMHYTAEIGRGALYIFIGLVFAVVFLLEREDLEKWREGLKLDSPGRIMMRYLGYVADAIAITLKLQVIVAVVNTLITLPVLVALRLPGIPALMALMLVGGLIPIVGGIVSGGVLMTVAYATRGPVGLAAFVASTFVLHKIESYYLTPRLTAKHIKLPSFVIITSLVLFEHAFGVIGLFLSFPCLYVAAKIREGWLDPADELREEEETTRAMRGLLPLLKGFRLRRNPLAARGGATDAAVTGSAATADPPPVNKLIAPVPEPAPRPSVPPAAE